MSDQQWSEQGLIVPPMVREHVEQPIQIERPPGVEATQVAPLPMPAPELRAVMANPVLAADLWNQLDNRPQAAPPVQRPDDSEAIIQMGMALYFLHAVHFPGKPGFEHLHTDEADERDDDDAKKPND
jgi:hypothetical protein